MTWLILKFSIQVYLLEIEKIFKSTGIDIYHIHHIIYITMKSLDHVGINTQNRFYVIFNKVDGYVEESNGNKYLIFLFTDKEKYSELWNKIKKQIKTISGGEPIECKKDVMKIWVESEDDLSLGKILSTPIW